MIFGPKRKYPLPKFPANVAPAFLSQQETLSADEAKAMLPGIDEVVAEKREQAAHNEFLDLGLVEKIADRARWLLQNYEQFPPDQQGMIVAAVRYFAHADDPLPEEALATGLDDDARVINHVLEELGVEDKYITEQG